jgi:hypothetical protein
MRKNTTKRRTMHERASTASEVLACVGTNDGQHCQRASAVLTCEGAILGRGLQIKVHRHIRKREE